MSERKFTYLKSRFCAYSDGYILVKGTITVPNLPAVDAAGGPNNRRKILIIKNCSPFTDCISEINNTSVDNAKG